MMGNGWLILLVLVIMIPLVLITALVPLLTRKIESFGVTVPEEAQQDADIAALRKQYIVWCLASGGAATLLLIWQSVALVSEKVWSYVLVGIIFGYTLVSFAIYLKQHYSVKRLKEARQWEAQYAKRVIINTRFRSDRLTVSYFWFVPHVLLIATSVLVGVLAYERFPELIPMQYGLDGEITRSVAKTQFTVLWPALLQSFMLIIFVFANYVISQSKQVAEAVDPEGSLRRNVKFRRYWSAYTVGIGFLTMLLFTIMQLGMLESWGAGTITVVIMSVVAIIVLSSIGLSLITGQGGSRFKAEGKTREHTVSDADLDQYWKLGVIYFNRSDPALFVEKRFGVGWTINFGRPICWLIIAGFIALVLLMVWTAQ